MVTSERHKQLEIKYFANSEENAFKKISKNAESTLRKKRQVNSLYLRKCIHTLFFLIQHRLALTNNYKDLIDFASNKLHESIIKQYPDSCQKNATYKSKASVESLLNAINIFFEIFFCQKIRLIKKHLLYF